MWLCQIYHCTLHISYNALFPLLLNLICLSFTVIIFVIEVFIQHKLYFKISDICICFYNCIFFVENAVNIKVIIKNVGII